MAFGISPYKQTLVPLGGYDPDHYLTLLYNAMVGLGWHIGYFDHDGLIAYSNISLASYSEEVSVRITNNWAVIKSECVGYQGFLTDYGKNAKNLERLFTELEYTDALLGNELQERTRELMDSIPENQFISLDNPPMVGKEKLHDFIQVFFPQRNYFITPILVLTNILVYVLSAFAMVIIAAYMIRDKSHFMKDPFGAVKKIQLYLGFNDRSSVLHGQVWRLVTNTFLHFSPMHLIGNMIALIYVGSMIESKLGKWNFLLLYLLTGITASMVSVGWNYNVVSGGASGAIYGLFGILLALASTDFYERNARKAILMSTAILVAITIIPIGRHIDHAAHFGGLISGYIFGLIFYAGIANRYSFSLLKSIAVTVFITCSLVCLGIKLLPDYKLKDYFTLIVRERLTESRVKNCYYGTYVRSDGANDTLIKHIEQVGFPLLNTLKDQNKRVSSFILPSKLKREADYRSKVVDLECINFNLYYRGLKEKNIDKYQPQIDSINNVINDLNQDFAASQ